jgi:hypothetical protein
MPDREIREALERLVTAARRACEEYDRKTTRAVELRAALDQGGQALAGDDEARSTRSLLQIEKVLEDYGVAIQSPLADAIRELLVELERDRYVISGLAKFVCAEYPADESLTSITATWGMGVGLETAETEAIHAFEAER